MPEWLAIADDNYDVFPHVGHTVRVWIGPHLHCAPSHQGYTTPADNGQCPGRRGSSQAHGGTADWDVFGLLGANRAY